MTTPAPRNQRAPTWLWVLSAVLGVSGALAHLALGNPWSDWFGVTDPVMKLLVPLVLSLQFGAPVFLGIAAATTSAELRVILKRSMWSGLITVLAPAPLMGQQIVCLIVVVPYVLVAAPLSAFLTRLVLRRFRRGAQGLGIALLLGGGYTASVIPSQEEREQTVMVLSDSILTPLSREALWASIDELQLSMTGAIPWWQQGLLPTPRRIEGGGASVGSIRTVSFDNGTVQAKVTESNYPSNFSFTLEVTETGPEFLDHYVQLERSTLLFEPQGHETLLTHTTWYRPLAFPRWYFEPIELVLGSYLQRQLLTQYQAQVSEAPADRVARR
jgi:hypothetical protein